MSDLRTAAQQALEVIHDTAYGAAIFREEVRDVLMALCAALAEPEPVAHRHEWIRTGAMKPNEMRCLQCGAWGEKE